MVESMAPSTLTSVAYCLAMGVCGLVLVSIGVTLSDLASNVGLSAEDLGSIFILRGGGAVFGSLYSATLYHDYPGNRVIAVALTGLAATCVALPFNTSWVGIHVLFLLLGLGTSVTDTGCQIMTRKLHGEKAGPYLGANTVAFGVSGCLVPVITFAFSDVYIRFFALTSIILGVLAVVVLSSEPAAVVDTNVVRTTSSLDEDIFPATAGRTWVTVHTHNSEGTMCFSPPIRNSVSASPSNGNAVQLVGVGISEGAKLVSQSSSVFNAANDDDITPPHFFTEYNISAMVFSVIGAKVTVTAYLDAYVQATEVIPVASEHSLMLLFWVFVTLGRCIGILNQQRVTTQTLPLHILASTVAGSLAALSLLAFPHNATVFWLAIPIYGLCNGPVLGYCYDLNNRLTLPTEKSMSIVMFGLNFGASIVPYISSVLWRDWLGPKVLLVVMLLSLAVPIPLLYAAIRVSYIKEEILGGQQTQYQSITPNEETSTN